jgi:hypothetical protein
LKKTFFFPTKINVFSVLQFCSVINKFSNSRFTEITIDFTKVLKVFPNGMLPIICTIDELRSKGKKIYIKLPENDEIRKLFRSVNWAFYLSPEQFEKSESTHDRHLVARRFENPEQQTAVVNDFMDVVLRSMTIPKDIISGLEWSINEITDNVLNHSESKHGGIIQASTHYKEKK